VCFFFLGSRGVVESRKGTTVSLLAGLFYLDISRSVLNSCLDYLTLVSLRSSCLIMLEVVSIALCMSVRTDSCIRPALSFTRCFCGVGVIDVIPTESPTLLKLLRACPISSNLAQPNLLSCCLLCVCVSYVAHTHKQRSLYQSFQAMTITATFLVKRKLRKRIPCWHREFLSVRRYQHRVLIRKRSWIDGSYQL